jgi:hypothetical protein
VNEYLMKLHRLESGAEGSTAEKPLAGAPTKPTQLGSVSFVSDPTIGFLPKANVSAACEPAAAMRPDISRGQKNASIGYRQNRQNPHHDREHSATEPFPFAGALDELERRCPEYVEPDRWQQCIRDAERFLADWGPQAEALEWSSGDLFGLHTPLAHPHPSHSRMSRRDCTGLLWGLAGRRVVALSSDTAAVACDTGSIVKYRKLNKLGNRK